MRDDSGAIVKAINPFSRTYSANSSGYLILPCPKLKNFNTSLSGYATYTISFLATSSPFISSYKIVFISETSGHIVCLSGVKCPAYIYSKTVETITTHYLVIGNDGNSYYTPNASIGFAQIDDVYAPLGFKSENVFDIYLYPDLSDYEGPSTPFLYVDVIDPH
jgi:hypothetical protein